MAKSTAVELSNAEKINAQIEPLVEDFEAQDPNAISAEIALRVLGLTNVDDILAAGESTTISAEDIGDRSFRMQAAPRWIKSRFAGNDESILDYFAIVNIVMEDDKSEQVLTLGATNACAQLVAAKNGGNPTLSGKALKFKTVRTGGGYDVIWLAAGEEKF